MSVNQGQDHTYAYQQMGSDPAEKLNVIASRTLSGIRGSTAASQAWTYTYTKGYSPNNDTTLENGPTQCVRYTHVGANTIANGASGVDQGLWKIGLLLKKETLAKSGTACGAVVRTETNTWGSQNVSDQNEVRRYNLLSENYTRAPILTEKVINQDGVNYTTDYTYDTYGQPLTVIETGQKSRTTTLTYTRPGNLWMMGKVATQAVSGVSGNLSNTYNTLGQLTQASKYGVISKYTYLSSGDLATITDANNHVTTYSDYYRGVPRSVKFADGGVMTRTVNATGTVATSVDPLKRTTSYTYDSMDRLSKVTPPKGATSATSIAYAFSTSNVTQTVKRGGYTRLREFNQLGQLIKQTESGTSLKSILSTATYTPDGQKSFVSIPNYTSASTVGETYTYDTLGRMLKDTHGDGTSISASYPSGSNSVVSTDERGNATTTVYAAYGDPAVRQITSITQPGNVVSTIVTDNLGRVTSNSQGGLSRTYAYNASGFLGSKTNPETGTTTYGYDAVGNLKSKQVGASAIDSYAYDAADRLLSINFGGTTPLTNSYDVGGRLLTQDFAGTNWSYGYDTHDKLTAETLTLTSPAKSYTFGYAYDAVDSLSSITYPSGRVVAYTPDAFGHSTQAGTYATGITYAANGAVLGLNYGNGRALAVTQDAKRLRTLSRTVAGSDVAMKMTYGYDGASNLTSITDGQNTAASQTLGYDALNRLTSATGLWGTATYTYNTRGDLTSQAGIRALTYTYDNQGRLSALSGDITSTLAYDTQGRVLSARGNYNYDAAGDLVSLCLQVRSDCATAPDQSFAYDARGKRVTQAFGSGKAVVDVYGYQGKLLLEETTPAGGTASANEYVYAANELVAEVASAGATYHHNDHLGSPVAATNAQGALLWTSHFQPYGDRQEKGQAATVGSVGYTGHVQDDESGLVYAGA
ncbi:MAG: Protein RhsC [Pseudomonas sp.]|nr:MAG: Protein RhsC [Pseudomonas sp.]